MEHKLNWFVDVIESYDNDDGLFIIRGVAIKEGEMLNGEIFMAEELELAAPSFRNKPILLDHKNEIKNIAGRTTNNCYYDSEHKAIVFEAIINDEDIIAMIIDGRITQVSIGAVCKDIVKEGETNVIRGINGMELSLVAITGCPSAQITFAQTVKNSYDNMITEFIKYPKKKKAYEKSIKKVKELVIKKEDPLDLSTFVCTKCGWSRVATLFGAPHKCGGCGSKDFLERARFMDKNGRIENPSWVKFNPDTNPYKDKIIQTDSANLKEGILPKWEQFNYLQDAIKRIEGNIKKEETKSPTKIKENKQMEKQIFKICRNKNRCNSYGIQRPLEHSKDGNAPGDKFCRFCGMGNTLIEK